MSLNSRKTLINRIRRGKDARKKFVESHLSKTIAYQIRAMRDALQWNQERLASEVGMNQNAISRLESPDYGKPTLTTLKRLAEAFDVGLVVRFVPFSEMVDWVSGTPRVNKGLTDESLTVPSFDSEDGSGSFDEQPARISELSTGGRYLTAGGRILESVVDPVVMQRGYTVTSPIGDSAEIIDRKPIVTAFAGATEPFLGYFQWK